jgi:ribulose-phosphate 3-epimerase
MPEVAGSLWSVAIDEQLQAAQRLRAAGLRRLHWDMSDGTFANPGGFTAPDALALTEATGLAAEAHIMAADPLREVDAWTEFCDLIVVHAETQDWQRAVDRIAARNCTPALAISPETPTAAVPSELAVLCMSVTPGSAGSALDDNVLTKLPPLRRSSPARRIGLDGGVQRRHVDRAQRAGATWLVVGTDLFVRDAASRAYRGSAHASPLVPLITRTSLPCARARSMAASRAASLSGLGE